MGRHTFVEAAARSLASLPSSFPQPHPKRHPKGLLPIIAGGLSLFTRTTPLSACPQCGEAITTASRPKTFCTPACQVQAANARRATTREGRALGLANPRAGRPLSPSPTDIPASDKTPASDAPTRLSEPMEKAHSKAGINAFELADLARLRGLSPWTPFRLIVSKDYQPRRKA